MDYAKGKIYSIRSHLTDDFYIGSTASTLSKRFYQHKIDNKGFIAGKRKAGCSSFQILNFGDSYIELLQDFPCENRNQLSKREGEFIRDNDCVNKVIIGRTPAEYYFDNQEKITEYNKEYYQLNRETIIEKQKEYYEQNKEEIKEKEKEYYHLNKEYKKEYREQNKEKLQEKFVCECGGKYTHAHKSHHFKTLNHLKFAQVCVPQQDEGQKIGTEDI